MGAGGERHDLEDDVRGLRELMELGELGEHYLATTDHLKPGMRLRTSAGIWTQITAVHAYVKTGHVYNLTIAELHT